MLISLSNFTAVWPWASSISVWMSNKHSRMPDPAPKSSSLWSFSSQKKKKERGIPITTQFFKPKTLNTSFISFPISSPSTGGISKDTWWSSLPPSQPHKFKSLLYLYSYITSLPILLPWHLLSTKNPEWLFSVVNQTIIISLFKGPPMATNGT